MDSLSIDKSVQFREEGYIKISKLLDIDDIETIRKNFNLKVKEVHNIDLEKYSVTDYSFNYTRRLPGMNPIMRRLKEEGFLALIENQLKQQVANLFGENNWIAHDLWYSLLSLPGLSNNWNIPKKTWHADEPVIINESLPLSLFTFVFLDEVAPASGAMIMITGTHRQGERIVKEKGAPDANLLSAYNPQIRNISMNMDSVKILAPHHLLTHLKDESEWFRDLSKSKSKSKEDNPRERIAKFMEQGTSHEDIKHKVIELTGEPGDVIFLDPRCLHSGASISNNRPRQVIRLDFKRLD